MTGRSSCDIVAIQRRTASWLAIIAGGFCVVVALLVCAAAFSEANTSPPTSPALEKMESEYLSGNSSEGLRLRIRSEDLRVRRRFRRIRAFLRRGAWLLFGGGIALTASLAWLTSLSPIQPAIPEYDPDARETEARASRWAVNAALAAGLLLLGILIGMGLLGG